MKTRSAMLNARTAQAKPGRGRVALPVRAEQIQGDEGSPEAPGRVQWPTLPPRQPHRRVFPLHPIEEKP